MADAKLLEQPPKVAMSRTKTPLFLDENLLALKPFLEKDNFRVLVAPQGVPDEQLIQEYLPGRVLITNNTGDFLYEASNYDFSIIDTQNMSKDWAQLAKAIHRAFIDFSLKAQHPGFHLVLHRDGNHLLRTDI